MTFQFKDYADQKAFESFAFGETSVYGPYLLHTWNSRHGDKHWIKETDLIEDSLNHMYALYEKHKENESTDS